MELSDVKGGWWMYCESFKVDDGHHVTQTLTQSLQLALVPGKQQGVAASAEC